MEKELSIITECLKKQLKLKGKDKISFLYSAGEGFTAGKFESTSGEAIISNGIFTYFWLKYDKKKEYYLDYLNPIKIKRL